MGGLLWWIGYTPPPPGRAGGSLDAGLGLQGEPARETVLSALLTGANPAPVTGARHRRGRPDAAWAAWLRACGIGTRLQARGLRVRAVTAWPPAAFRGAPTVEMLAAPDGPATLGDLRRGLALAADVTGDALIARGHGGVAPRTPAAAGQLLAERLGEYAMLIFTAARTVDPATARTALAAVAAAGGAWLATAVPDTLPEGRVLWAANRDPAGSRPSGVTDLAGWMVRVLEEAHEGA